MKELGIKNIITGIFVIAAIVAFMVFSGVVNLGGSEQRVTGTVTVWGTVPYQTIQRYIDQVKEQNITITYSAKNESTYEDELINAFASGTGPDLFIMPHEDILRHGNKILEIPYTSFPRNNYEATYINEARLFLSDTGVMALPMTVDPLIMYYNKALISSSFILDIPQYWDELSSFAPQVTQYSGTGEVSISATALGTYDNVPHAKSLIATLMMQNGMNIVGTNTSNNSKRSILTLDDELLQKTVQAVDFYTSFASFGSNTYSWNEALVNAQNKFIAGEVGLYFGRASEVDNIRRKNPNLDFGVQLLPQVRGNTTRLTHGAMMGVAISKQTTNPTAAINVASKLAGQIVTEGLANDMLSAPTRKDLLRDKPDDALRTLVYNSAIISAGWVDTDPVKTNELFRSMIRNINTGAVSTRDALARMNADLNTILDQTINQDIGQNN